MPARDAATGRFTSGGSNGGVDLGSAYAKVLIDESGVDSGISSIQDKFQSLGSSLTSIGSSMTMIGAPFLAVAGLAVKAASDYQDQVAQLDAVLKSTTAHNGEYATSTAMSADDLQKLSDKLETATSKLGDMQTVYDSNTKHTVAQTLALKNQKDEVAALTAQMAAGNATTSEMVNVTHLSRQALLDLAYGFSQTTKFSKDTTLEAENMLLTFTKIDKDVFPDATKTTLDMAQALGEDAKSAAMQLGKALNDPIKGVTALRRVGVQLSDSQEELVKHLMAVGDAAGAQKVILQELQTEFGGSAVAAGQTFSGQLAILQHNFDDLLETIGFKLMPILEQLINGIKAGIFWFQNLDPAVQNIIIGIGAFMASLAILGPIIAAIGVGIGAIGTILGVILSPIGLVIAAIVGLYVAFQNNFLGIRDFLQPIITDIGNFFAHFSDNIKLYGSLALLYFEYYITNPLSDFWNTYLKPAFDSFSNWFTTDGLPFINTALNDFKTNIWNPLVDLVSKIWNTVKGELGHFADWFTKDGFQEIIKWIGDFKKNTIDPFIKSIQDLWTRAQPFLDAFKNGIATVFNWITNNVIEPMVHALDDLITKLIPLSSLSTTSQNGGSTGAATAAAASNFVLNNVPPSGVQPIPPVGGGSAAAPSGSVGVGAQGISGDTYHVTVNANDAAGGKAAGDAFTKALDDRYRGRGN